MEFSPNLHFLLPTPFLMAEYRKKSSLHHSGFGNEDGKIADVKRSPGFSLQLIKYT